jgi:hypothetical protein
MKSEELKIRGPYFELYRMKPSSLFKLRRLKHGFIHNSLSRRRSMLYQRSVLCSIRQTRLTVFCLLSFVFCPLSFVFCPLTLSFHQQNNYLR